MTHTTLPTIQELREACAPSREMQWYRLGIYTGREFKYLSYGSHVWLEDRAGTPFTWSGINGYCVLCFSFWNFATHVPCMRSTRPQKDPDMVKSMVNTTGFDYIQYTRERYGIIGS